MSKENEKLKFNNGDVVQLKSGGPCMTINESNDNSAMCIWFPNDSGVSCGNFNFFALKKIEK